jgi:A/G-specific adenine glycosylase
MVSEIMLQQTQVDRVIPMFEAFIKRFPTAESLAAAPVADVIRLWQGLGYNRRGLNLQKAAQIIDREYNGQLPSELEELLKLPGIGHYTAPAIQAFAFNLPSIVIETNIRAVFIHHFFPETEKVSDDELVPLIEQTLDRKNPRRWYSALMDYGSHLKSQIANPTRRSQTHTKQSRFEGSARQVRGQILKLLSNTNALSARDLQRALSKFPVPAKPIINQMVKEGFIEYDADQYSLPRS